MLILAEIIYMVNRDTEYWNEESNWKQVSHEKRCYVRKKPCDILLNVETAKLTSDSVEASLFSQTNLSEQKWENHDKIYWEFNAFLTVEETNVKGTRKEQSNVRVIQN